MRRNGRPLSVVTLVLGALATLPLTASPAGAVEEPVALQTTLAGLREVGADGSLGAGDLDGVGAATISVQPTRLCFSLNATGIDLPAAAGHIHEAGRGVNGPIVVTLAPLDADGRATGCVEDVDTALLDDLAGSPGDYYVNVHTAAFPDGAVRGQLQLAPSEGALFATQLSGAAEIGADGQPGVGDTDGTGMATVAVSTAARRVCVEISAQAVTLPAAAAHIHQARAGANGPVVIPLATPDARGFSMGCVRQLDQAVVDALADDPVAFYVNVHTSDFPDGAVRGQLTPAEWLTGGGSYADDARWMCRSGLAVEANVCETGLDTTVVEADGTLTVVPHVVATEPAYDCFYVYPTVRLGIEGNAAFDGIYGEEIYTARSQTGRFSRSCEVYAPLYRQRTLGAPSDTGIPYSEIAYADVFAAFQSYLATAAPGRPFMVIGHSQGSGLLRRLVADEIERNPSVQARLVSALLLGSTVSVPEGGDVGGSFQSVPACRAEDQFGCVVSYASFRDTVPPPDNSFFGRSSVEGQEALCTNPSALSGGSADLVPYFDIAGDSIFSDPDPTFPWADDFVDPPAITTPFVALPGLVTATCVDDGEFSYLSVHVNADPGPRRDDIPGDLTPEWGLHLVDVSVAMGNLVDLVEGQAAAWLAANA